MVAITTEPPLHTPADNDREKYLTAKEFIGDIECEILLEKDASGQYHEVMLTPIGEPPDNRRF